MALEFNNDNYVPRIPHTDMGNGGNENSENYDSNYAIAQEISSRIGVEPIPFNSVYDIALAIYRELGGEEEGFDSVYSILLEILPLVEGGGGKEPMQEVTYAELKALRDNSQLVPGQQYRITDYVTTTDAHGTQSAGHPFDIIVTADSENKLNENARAIKSASDYKPIHYHIDDNEGLGYAYDGAIVIDGVKYYKWFTDEITPSVFTILTEEKVYTNTPDGEDDCGEYYLTAYPFAGQMNSDEEVRDGDYWGSDTKKSIVKTVWVGTMSAAIQIYNPNGDTHYVYGRYPQGDTSTQYAWVLAVQSNEAGKETIDDITLWDLCDYDTVYYLYTSSETPNIGDTATGDSGTFEITDYQTDIPNGGSLVIGDAFDCNNEGYQTDSYFGNCKLEAWELKYCLDNDTNRFGWAQEGREGLGFAAIQLGYTDIASKLAKRYPEGDEEGYYAWAYVVGSENDTIDEFSGDWDDIETEWFYYTESEAPIIGEWDTSGDLQVQEYSQNVGYVPSGKGVIYSMKDEFNNQAYFDYKNIKIFEENNGDYCYLFGDDDTDAAKYDGTISGLSYNNTIAGQVSDGLLTLDTSKCFFNSYDYNNLIPTVKDIPVEFGITVDASMKPTAIIESSTGDYSVDDMKDDSFNGAKVHARFAFETSQGGMTVTVLTYLEGVLNNAKTEITVGEQVLTTDITPTMVFHKSNEVWTVWYDNIHSSWKITVNQ